MSVSPVGFLIESKGEVKFVNVENKSLYQTVLNLFNILIEKLDAEKNKVRGEEKVISTDDSKVKVVVVPTDEELMIATDTLAILEGK